MCWPASQAQGSAPSSAQVSMPPPGRVRSSTGPDRPEILSIGPPSPTQQNVEFRMSMSVRVAGDNYRRVVELIQTGAIGPVREVHVWVSRAWGWQASQE